MAKKAELNIIHPRVLIEAISAYQVDAMYALSTLHNALSFLKDGSLDPAKVVKAVIPQMEEAIGKLERWYI